MLNKNNYLVKSANWTMTIQIDETIFDDPHIEACTRCIETKIKKLKEEDDFLVNPIMIVKSLKRKNSKEKIVNTYKVLLNASFQFRAETLRRVFYDSTDVDLAKEPLSSSKY
jgi:hypothetical protein|tara:strand:- start:1111 stop:1446 length:336 start_codon:yes stop_codon:yes gene_type:complete